MLNGTTLHLALNSISYEIGSVLEVRVINQTELSFSILFILRGSWILIALQKIQDRKTPQSRSRLAPFRVHFFDFRDNKL